ncbi:MULTISPECIES: hypothetical protein [Methylorubrum]|uniref:hypothetical protein n=1 Tax=Methylorubrum TaxID=2282523 RepID=UPI0020A066C3|nr:MULTISPECIES: hypothetical protein [Methylorubrum]MCP1546997.1 uncharacterized protein YwgA [Methylorubrum zatmanii]MCP1551724.1 uncharacterized protein YwgA [Methylorubrum extorquens]MCP1577300.1 uncharacterized protein YwgA [Methylorubrum extorquens]
MTQDNFEKVASIIGDAGGRVVGRTKLQKIAFILEAAGLGAGFKFEYYHYGPFSEGLAHATRDAVLAGVVTEKEQPAAWGGFYSTYEVDNREKIADNKARLEIAQIGSKANSVELELAATALYLSIEKCPDPWEETARRKPEKSEAGRLARAKELYKELSSIETPRRLPIL